MYDTAWKFSIFGVFSVRFFPYSGIHIPVSVFNPNAGKYGPEKLQRRALSTQYKLLAGLDIQCNIFNGIVRFVLTILFGNQTFLKFLFRFNLYYDNRDISRNGTTQSFLLSIFTTTKASENEFRKYTANYNIRFFQRFCSFWKNFFSKVKRE